MVLQPLDDLWSELKSSWRNARRGDTKGVHQLRVTSRRIIAALEFVRAVFENDDASQLRRRLGKLLRRVGEVRDIHVQRSLSRTLPSSSDLKNFRRYLK